MITLCIRTEINVCNPNPCENEGVCLPLDDNTPSCSCPNLNVKGDLCEQTIVEVDDMPILEQNRLSDPISIHANPTSTAYITIIVDSTIKVLPSDTVSITSPASSASFQLQPSVEGIFEIVFKMSTTDQLIPPNNQILVVSNSGANNNGYYKGLDAPVRGLSPGCCRITTEVACPSITQAISLSSSCSWSSASNQFKTSGVVFAHINSLSLPLSIAGIEFHNARRGIKQISQGEVTCSRCSSASSDVCFKYLPNIHDIDVFMEKQAFIDEFYQSISSILPPLITMDLIENENKAELHASILSGRDLLMVEGCKDLDVHISKTYHVLKTKQGLVFSYMNEHNVYENHDVLSSLCFATDVCNNGLIHVGGLTQEANNQLNTLQSFKTFLEKDWNIEFKYFSLFQSQQNYPGKHLFWNGNAFFEQHLTKFNIKTRLNAMGNFTSSHLLVNFVFQGNIHSSTVSDAYCVSFKKTSSSCMTLCNFKTFSYLFLALG